MWCMLPMQRRQCYGWNLRASGPRALVASLALSGALAGTALAQTPLMATLSGPGNGDGMASVTLDPGASTVCYEVTAAA